MDDRYQKGMEKGRAEGELSKSQEIARNLLTLGVPIAQIIQATGLSPEKIERLKKA